MTMSQRMWKREQERKRRERLKRARRRRNCAIAVFVSAVAAVVIIVSRSCDNSSQPMSEAMTAPQINEAVPTASVEPDLPFIASVDASELDLSGFDNAAFVGNSVAESVALYNILPETDFYSSVNLDLENVYTTASRYGSMAVADQLKSKKFSRVFLSFGERELAWDDAARFGIEYRKFIEKVKEYQPSASVYVISIPPVTKSVSSANLYGMNAKAIKEYNRRIRNMAYSEKLYYVDSVAALGRNGGYLLEGSSADGINLNKEYITELIYYIKNKAYIPNTPAADEDEDETETPEEKKTTPAPSPVSTDEPEPTVNVLKDSAIRENEKN